MISRFAILLCLAVSASGCSIAQLERTAGVVAASSGLQAVASRIDSGVRIAVADLPLACRITADVAAVSARLASSGVFSESRRLRLSQASLAASTLASSGLCLDPASDPAGLSLQIAAAVSAIRKATAGAAPEHAVSASIVVTRGGTPATFR